jgi:hypothetical protein
MKIRELLESKYDYSLADYEATPYDTGFEWRANGRAGILAAGRKYLD